MTSGSRIRVYIGCSFDGFIAGPDDDLSFLEDPDFAIMPSPGPEGALGFEAFMAQVGALLMGRRTYDVVAGMGVWMYGEKPVLVPSHRELEPVAPTVRRVEGDIQSLIQQARSAAGDKDVYLDGGDLIRQALNAGLVDELCITMLPVLVGQGIRLFDGLAEQTKLEFAAVHGLEGGMVQVTARPRGWVDE